jgi:hypothetical protein
MKNRTFTLEDYDKVSRKFVEDGVYGEEEKKMVSLVLQAFRLTLEVYMLKKELPADMDED